MNIEHLPQKMKIPIGLLKKRWHIIPKVLSLFFISFCIPICLDAEEIDFPENEKISLVDALQQLSKDYQVFFSYDQEVVQDIEVNFEPEEYTGITHALDEMLVSTSLKYKVFNNRYIIIYERSPEALSSLRGMVKHLETVIDSEEKVPFRKTILPISVLPTRTNTFSVKSVGFSVSGIVTDKEGEPLIGVNIQVKDTNKGIATDFDGKFILEDIDENAVLVISYIGYQTQELEISGETQVHIVLLSDAQLLEEVVVVGYGFQKKESLTGSVSSLRSDDLNATATGDVTSRLQGRVAGVTINASNEPGGQATVRVRGYGSLGNNNPLYIIDGIPRTNMDNINPNDIESISVLKDASSSAIYGSRAANGVIVITTKTGLEGPPKLDFSLRYGVQNKSNGPDLLNSEEVGMNLWQKYRNMGLEPGDVGWGNIQYGFGPAPIVPDYVLPAGKMEGEVDESTYSWPNPYNAITKTNKNDFNWYESVFIPAPIQDYNLTLSGGNNGSNYSISAGYFDRIGIVNYKGDEISPSTKNGFKRYSLRSNADIKINDWLQIGPRLSATYNTRLGIRGPEPIIQANTMHPLLPIYDIQGNFAGTKTPSTGNRHNPIALLVRNKDDYLNNMILQGSTYAQIRFLKDFLFRTMIGVNYNSSNSLDRDLSNPEFNQASTVSRLNVGSNFGFQYNWTNSINYLKTIGDFHNINLLIGTEAYNYKTEFLSGSRSTFAFTNLDYMVLDSGEKDVTNSGNFDHTRLFSYFGRINYDYKGKYLFEGVLRRDGSSRFVDKYRWGTFPAFSVGWRVTEEPFLSDISWLDDVKLRFGWGKNGNDNVGNYNAYSTYIASGAESYYNISGSSRTSSEAGFHASTLGNPLARWETNVATNFGLDLFIFKSKLQATIDVYKRRTTDMLYQDSKPGTWGQINLPDINIGEMQNTGFDFSLTYWGNIGNDFSYSLNGNVSHFKNKVNKLNDNPNEKLYGDRIEASYNTITQRGLPLRSFYGYLVEGIFNTADEVESWPKFNPDINGNDSYSMPGVFKYKDVNGDGVITPDDRVYLGDGYPDLTYGFNIDLKYRNFDLSSFFQGVIGRSIINNTKRTLLFIRNDGNYLRERLYESWTEERFNNGSKISLPITINNDANMQLSNSFFIESGDYLRLKNLQLGYSLPLEFLSKFKIENFRLYLQGSNLFTYTKYSGIDVEVNEPGIDNNVYPISRVFLFGINLTF